MTTRIPEVDMTRVAGGFMQRLLRKFSKPFNPDPKAATALTFVPSGGTPLYTYLSVQNATLYLHNQPLDTPVYTPEVSYDLTQYNLTALASVLTAGGYGYTVTAASSQDGTNASMLLGFVDFALDNVNTVELQIATSRLWKYLYPIAMASQEADSLTTDAVENEMNVTLARGFWLDFWGDWLGVPRIPGMTDLQYAAYIFLNLKTPRVNNMAMEDLLEARYQVPIQVKDSGQYQFTINFDAKLMGTIDAADLTKIVNEIRGTGITWLQQYLSSFSEDYSAYYAGRYGVGFTTGGAQVLAEQSIPLEEGPYGYSPWGNVFAFNQGAFNMSPFPVEKRLNDVLSPPQMGVTQTETYTPQSGNSTLGMFGTSAGQLYGLFNLSKTYSGMQEAVTMYYNSRSDASFTMM